MKSFLNTFTILLVLSIFSIQLASQDCFSIYLVRHAEKQVSKNHKVDPALTKCGMARAESLALFLKDVKIDTIYSTDYIRTMDTAKPVARLKNQNIVKYDPNALDAFAARLLQNSRNALIVGHSNTTVELAQALIREEGLKGIEENEYDRIYQIIVCEELLQLNVFHTTLKCNRNSEIIK